MHACLFLRPVQSQVRPWGSIIIMIVIIILPEIHQSAGVWVANWVL